MCGMTVYDLCHLGHARAFTDFDAIVRFLRWSGWKVRFVRNITDVDDKILQRAADTGVPWREVVEANIAAMDEDFGQLGILPPDEQPRATQHIQGMVEMIQQLVTKGFAYRGANGDYYYRVNRFEGYGKLSGKKLDDLLVGARIEVDPNKEDPRDFALWKAASADQVGWDTEIGRGRPGWHIECSVMSKNCLGDNFDIHGGGPDLRFPHHENEIAQSEAANGCTYANYWIHAGTLRIDGEKMSKSLGNFFTIREVLTQYHPEVVRFYLLSSHYRSEINYSLDGLAEAKRTLDRFYQALRGVDVGEVQLESNDRLAGFELVMSDDFNTREAIRVMNEALDELNQAKKEGDNAVSSRAAGELLEMGHVLGFLEKDPDAYLTWVPVDQSGLSSEEIDALVAERSQAKLDKNYARADQIRTELADQGVQLDDSREGTTWRRI